MQLLNLTESPEEEKKETRGERKKSLKSAEKHGENITPDKTEEIEDWINQRTPSTGKSWRESRTKPAMELLKQPHSR